MATSYRLDVRPTLQQRGQCSNTDPSRGCYGRKIFKDRRCLNTFVSLLLVEHGKRIFSVIQRLDYGTRPLSPLFRKHFGIEWIKMVMTCFALANRTPAFLYGALQRR